MIVRELLKNSEDKKLPAYAWPGGYQILYYARDGFVFCPQCANAVLADDGYSEDDKPTHGEIYYEGPSVECEHCHKMIESAYGDPNSKESE
jgi:hypothetical protein